MSNIHRISIFRTCAVIVLASSMLTLVPAITSSMGSSPDQGGHSVIHKNGGTPVWMANIRSSVPDGVWI